MQEEELFQGAWGGTGLWQTGQDSRLKQALWGALSGRQRPQGRGSTGCRVLRKSHLASQALSDPLMIAPRQQPPGVCVGKGFGRAGRW